MDPAITTNEGVTCMISCCQNGHAAVVRRLLGDGRVSPCQACAGPEEA